MLETTTQTFDIRRIRDVEAGDRAETVIFQDGSRATLCADHPDHDMLLWMARWGLRYGQLLGVAVDSAGRLLDLNSSDESQVRFVRDDDSRLKVAFWAMSPVCYLCRDHPEFERLRSTLEQAMAAGSLVRFAHHLRPEESETETWWKIMDVRPIGTNGVAPAT
jgi:hypothetical protein